MDNTKEMMVDMRKERRPHWPLVIWGLEVQRSLHQHHTAAEQGSTVEELQDVSMLPKILSSFHSSMVDANAVDCRDSTAHSAIAQLDSCLHPRGLTTPPPPGRRYRSMKSGTWQRNSFFPTAIKPLNTSQQFRTSVCMWPSTFYSLHRHNCTLAAI